jgi:hypothetical protein
MFSAMMSRSKVVLPVPGGPLTEKNAGFFVGLECHVDGKLLHEAHQVFRSVGPMALIELLGNSFCCSTLGPSPE